MNVLYCTLNILRVLYVFIAWMQSLRVWRRRPGWINNRWGGGGHGKSAKKINQIALSRACRLLSLSLYLSVCFDSAVVLQLDLPGGHKWALAETTLWLWSNGLSSSPDSARGENQMSAPTDNNASCTVYCVPGVRWLIWTTFCGHIRWAFLQSSSL